MSNTDKQSDQNSKDTKINVLFVCTGNICRSPTAEGVFRHLVTESELLHVIGTDSAGTHDYHVGEPPDSRSQSAAWKRGIDLSGLRAREVQLNDFHRFDYILAMDRSHQRHLQKLCPKGSEHKIKLFLEYAPHLHVLDVPDPYTGGSHNFEIVMKMIEIGAKGLLEDIKSRHEL